MKDKNKNKKILLTAVASIVAVVGVICGIYWPNSKINDTISEVQNTIIEEIQTIEEQERKEVVISEYVHGEVSDTKEATENGEDVSTAEIIESSEEEEKEITDEGALEVDAVVEQENISYNGDSTGNGLSLLGAYQGLTYYSQADSRWANIMYSSVGDSSQTMKSSACGPTSAAMVVSSSKGAILPTVMANLSVANGYRTANNGTAWAYYSFVADYFDFNEFHTTSNFNTAMDYLKTDKDNDGNSDYYVIVSCGSGLFTTGGHYIVLVSDKGGTINVYDPYLYTGKFTTASRKSAGVVVSGNNAFVSESSFEKYANYKYFWIFSNDKGSGNLSNNSTSSNTTASVNYTRYVATQSSNLNVRDSAGGSVINSLRKGTAVTVVESDGAWSRITSPVKGWVSSSYLSATSVNTIVTQTTAIPKSGVVKVKTALNVRTGAGKSNPVVKTLQNGNAVYIYESKNGWYRIGTNLWVSSEYIILTNSNTSNISASYSTNIGNYYTLKTNTKLYSKGTLSGTTYNYLYGTKIKVISHYSNSVDYIYVPKTGRYAYCKISAYK